MPNEVICRRCEVTSNHYTTPAMVQATSIMDGDSTFIDWKDETDVTKPICPVCGSDNIIVQEI